MIAPEFQGKGFTILCVVLMSCAVTLSNPASDSTLAYVVKVNTSLDIRVARTSYTEEWAGGCQLSWPPVWVEKQTVKHCDVMPLSLSGIGSAWIIEARGGELVIVTASHVLFVGTTHPSIDPSRDKIISRSVRCLMGITSIEPSDIAIPFATGGLGVPKRKDVALMKASGADLRKIVQPLHLADHLPRQMEAVSVISFQSDTAFQQVDAAIVAAVNPEQGVFVLNKAIPAGGSGGAVVDVSNNCYGVVSGTEKGQTVGYSVTSEMINTAKWIPAKTALTNMDDSAFCEK